MCRPFVNCFFSDKTCRAYLIFYQSGALTQPDSAIGKYFLILVSGFLKSPETPSIFEMAFWLCHKPCVFCRQPFLLKSACSVVEKSSCKNASHFDTNH